MAHKLKFDISHENFDQYFANQVMNMTDEEKAVLPKELQFKLFRKGGVFNAKSTNKLTFLQRLYVLAKARKKRVVIMVEDEENGLSEEDFVDWKKGMRREELSDLFAEKLQGQSEFFLADSELFKTFAYLNRVSVSPAYNYVSRIKNLSKNKVKEFQQQSNYVLKFISNYEAQKKKIVMQQGLSLAELYILFYLYDGIPKLASAVYTDKYKYAYNASKSQMHSAFRTLQQRGFVDKIGDRKGAKLRITVSGNAMAQDILQKYFINF